MATLVQLADRTDRPAEKSTGISNDLHAASHFLHLIVKTFLGALVLPVLLAISLIVFLVVLADFAWFRFRDLRHGLPQPKGLWEF